MTTNGTDRSNIIVGTNAGNVINANGGNDIVLAGNGNDTVDGGSGNDLLSGGNGNDDIAGGSGCDLISGDNGNDTLDGGSGSDIVLGGRGNDTLIYNAAENATAFDIYDGGQGRDTLRLVVTQAIYDSQAFQDDLANLNARLSRGASYAFQSIDLLVTSIERLEVVVVGGNQAPVAGNDSVAGALEDNTLTIPVASLLANDSDPDGNPFTIVGVGNAQHGSVSFNGSNVTFVPATNFSGTAFFQYTIEDSNGAQSTATVTVNVAAVADAPTASASAGTAIEDQPIALNITSALTDTDGSETVVIHISGVPDGASLSAGTSLGGGVWALSSAQLPGLTLSPPPGYSGSINLSVTAISTESSNNSTAQTSVPLVIEVAAVADAPSVSAGAGTAVEDTPVALNIAGTLADTDGSEVLTFQISGVPAGASLSNGTDLGGGVWALSSAQLPGLTLSPPPNYSGSINLSVTAISSESSNGSTAETSTTLAIEVAPVADAPDVSAPAASGSAVGGIALTILATAVDADGSESIQSIEIDGVPPSYLLSAGTPPAEDGGAWVLTPAQLAGLTMIPVDPVVGGAHGDFELSITVTSVDGTDIETTTVTMPVSIAAPPGAVSGIASDGYIAGGTVFADTNENGNLDDGEAFTTTAADGTFTLIGGIGPLVMRGGVDITTGLAFEGVLKAPEGSTVITPLTTLVSELTETLGSVAAAESAVVAAFGLILPLGESLQTFDPIPAAIGGDPNATAVLSAAVQVQSTISQVTAVGGTQDSVIGAIASAITNPAITFDLGSTETVQAIAGATSGVNPAAVATVVEVVAAANDSIQSATTVTQIAQAAVVAQGEATEALASTNFNDEQAVDDLTQTYVTELETVVQFAEVGDVDGATVGTIGNDTLTGTGVVNGIPVVDAIEGLDGDDVIAGLEGDDLLYGGGGKDRITGGEGNDLISGGAGFDRSIYTHANAAITVALAAGTVTGGDGNDTLESVESIRGTAFNDSYDATGFTAVATLANPNAGGDQGTFNEFEGMGGDDTIAGNGNTRISYQTATGAVNVDLDAGTAFGDLSVGTDTITGGVGHVRGSSHNDTLTGSDTATGFETFEGWGGDDFIDGNGGNDRARYDNQNTGTLGIMVDLGGGTITGRDAAATAVVGTDTLRSIESVRGSNSADIFDASTFTANSTNGGGDQGNFNEFEGMGGDDTVIGNGNTRLSYASATGGVTVNMATGTATGNGSVGTDTFAGVNVVRGSNFDDTLIGSSNGANPAEQFEGWGGDDTIDGGLGFDRARYDTANSAATAAVNLVLGISVDMAAGTVTGRDAAATSVYGTDTLQQVEAVRGTNLDDVYVATGFNGASSDATPFGTTFNEFEGMGGNDTVTGNGNTRINFGSATGGVTVDLIAGTATGDASVGTDTITGGVSRVRGSNSADVISGNNGNNSLEGQAGADRLDGRGGNDTLIGGTQADTFVYGDGYGADTVNDFNRAQSDKIDLTGVTGVYDIGDLNLSAVPGGTLINFGGGNTLTVNGTTPLIGTDFIFATNPAPTAIQLSETDVDENSAGGTVVGALSATDPADTVTFTLLDDAVGRFAIVGNDLVVAGPLDFESGASHSVTVQVTDSSNNTYQETFVIDVNDVNEAPTAVSFANPTTIDENVTVPVGGIKVADIVVTDDALGAETLTLSGADAGSFAISSGALYYVGPSPDFETKSSYSVTVSAADLSLGAPAVSQTFVLAINNLAGITVVAPIDANNNTLTGTPESDTIDYSATSLGVVVFLGPGTATGPEIGSDTVTGFENVIGGSGDDILRGNPGDNQIFGGAGNDLMSAGLGGTDLFNGGSGLDHVTYEAAGSALAINLAAGTGVIGGNNKTFLSVELIRGSSQNDSYDATGYGAVGAANVGNNGTFNEFEGLDGDDTITGNGNTRVSYVAAAAAVTVTLGANGTGSAFGTTPGDLANIGTDTFLSGVSHVRGSNFNDTLTGSLTASGFEIFEGRGGDDFIDGEGGLDRVRYDNQDTGALGITVNLGAGTVTGRDAAATAVIGTDSLRQIESVRGTDSDDILDATGFSGSSTNAGDQGTFNELEGMGGDDQIIGNGNTRLSFVSAAAAVTASIASGTSSGVAPGDLANVGNDTFSGVNAVRGSSFDDMLFGSSTGTGPIEQFEGWGGNDTIDGAGGIDRVRYDSNDTAQSGIELVLGVAVNMAAGTVTGRDAAATAVYGTDTLVSVESVRGTDLDDVYAATGYNGASLDANLGADFNEFEGMGGDDLITGNGNTRLFFGAATAGVTVDLVAGTASGDDSVGSDSFTFVSRVRGSNFDDTISGDGAVNTLEGQGGNDTIDGRGGNDTIIGGAGGDFLTGGADNDTFRFAAMSESAPGVGTFDTITDFAVGQDIIHLGQIDANTSQGGNQTFGFVGAQTSAVQANSVTWFQDGTNTIIQADNNGDGNADLMITLTGLKNLTNTDFVL